MTQTPPVSIPVVDTWQPSDYGMLGAAFDPGPDLLGGFGLTSGTIYLVRVPIRTSKLVTNVVLFLQAIGVTLTAGQSFAGLYAGQASGPYAAGQRIGVSADQSVAFATAGNANSYMPIALTGGPFPLLASIGWAWAAVVSNGTTPPAFGRGVNFNATASNSSLGNAAARFATNGTGTALPASITPASNVFLQQTLWAGIS